MHGNDRVNRVVVAEPRQKSRFWFGEGKCPGVVPLPMRACEVRRGKIPVEIDVAGGVLSPDQQSIGIQRRHDQHQFPRRDRGPEPGHQIQHRLYTGRLVSVDSTNHQQPLRGGASGCLRGGIGNAAKHPAHNRTPFTRASQVGKARREQSVKQSLSFNKRRSECSQGGNSFTCPGAPAQRDTTRGPQGEPVESQVRARASRCRLAPRVLHFGRDGDEHASW